MAKKEFKQTPWQDEFEIVMSEITIKEFSYNIYYMFVFYL